jgi:hypothetical protein
MPPTACYGLTYPLRKPLVDADLTIFQPNYLVRSELCPYIWAINEQQHAMNATATFAADLKEMMNNWNELVRRASELFPNDTEEQRYERVKSEMNKSIGLE